MANFPALNRFKKSFVKDLGNLPQQAQTVESTSGHSYPQANITNLFGQKVDSMLWTDRQAWYMHLLPF